MNVQRLVKEFKLLNNNSSYISDNSKELNEKYSNKFIAVFNNKIVGVDNDFDKLVQFLTKKKISLRRAIIEYIPEKGQIILY